MVRKINGKQPGDPMEDLNVNLAIWVMCHEYHSSSSGSSGKRQKNRKADQWSDRNHLHKPDQFPRFDGGYRQAYCTVELINTPQRKSMPSPTLCSVWGKWETILLNPGRNKFNGIWTTVISVNWIELMDNLWNSSGRFSQDSLQWQSSMRFNRWWENYSVNQRTSQARSSSCQCSTTLCEMQKGNEKLCVNNSKRVEEYAWRFPRGHWSFLGPRSEKKWYATYNSKPNGCWDRTAEKMLHNFAGSGHPIFRCTSALERERGQLRSKGGGRTSIHFNGSTQNIELLLQMVISVNQLSLYGAVADMIEELPNGQRAPGKPAAWSQLDEQEILTQPPLAEAQANEERQGNLLQENEQRFEKLSEDQKLSKLCSEASLNLVEVGQFFCALPSPRAERKSIFKPRMFGASRSRRNSFQRMNPKQCTIWPSLRHKSFAINTEGTVLKFKFNHCYKIKPYLGLELSTVLTNLSEKPCRSERKRKLGRNVLQRRDQY